MFKRLLRPESCIFLVVWFTLVIVGRGKLFRDPGTFWHTKLGQTMWSTGKFIDGDTYSYSALSFKPQERWVPHSWLAEFVMGGLYDISGWDGLLWLTATLLAGLSAWIASRFLRAGFHWSVTLLFTSITIAASANHYHARPHVASFLLFGLTCALLSDCESGRIPLRRLLWLIPIHWVWSCLHAAALGGWCTLVLVVAGWTVYRILGWESPCKRWRDLGALYCLVLACGLTFLVNPYGWRLPHVWYEILSIKHLSVFVSEHVPLDPLKIEGAMHPIFGLVYLVILLGLWPRRPRVTELLPLAWLVLGFLHIRHSSLFAMVAAVVLPNLFPRTYWARLLKERGSDWFVPPVVTEGATCEAVSLPSRLAPYLLPLVLISASFVLQVRGVVVPVIGSGWARIDETAWPVELVDRLCSYPPGTRIFNDLNLGGFLIFNAPQLQIFADDRFEIYGDEFMVKYFEVVKGGVGGEKRMREWIAEFHPELALGKTDEKDEKNEKNAFNDYLSNPKNGWVVLESTPVATLYAWSKSAFNPQKQQNAPVAP